MDPPRLRAPRARPRTRSLGTFPVRAAPSRRTPGGRSRGASSPAAASHRPPPEGPPDGDGGRPLGPGDRRPVAPPARAVRIGKDRVGPLLPVAESRRAEPGPGGDAAASGRQLAAQLGAALRRPHGRPGAPARRRPGRRTRRRGAGRPASAPRPLRPPPPHAQHAAPLVARARRRLAACRPPDGNGGRRLAGPAGPRRHPRLGSLLPLPLGPDGARRTHAAPPGD